MLRVIESTASSARLREAAAFLDRYPATEEILVVGPSRGAADDLARATALRHGATFGHHRFSFTELAARLSASALARRGATPGTMLGSEAVAARAAFDARRVDKLSHFKPVCHTPGFPRALAQTLIELRLAGIGPERLRDLATSGSDLADLLARFDEQFRSVSAADRAAVFRLAASELEAGETPWSGHLLVLLDVPIISAAEREFVAALVAGSSAALATVPFGDVLTREALRALGDESEQVVEQDETSDLARLRRYLFEVDGPAPRPLTGDLKCFSAPGEGRECVELARCVLDEARKGVPFDEMAILLRSPESYVGLLEHALRRAGVPGWFDRGTRRPDPSGRAFLALLACRIEDLSARRFAEYLSLGQVPALDERHVGSDPALDGDALAVSDESLQAVARLDAPDEEENEPRAVAEGEHDAATAAPDTAVVAGALQAPWKWEELLVESAVIGGRERWIRRLDGLEAEYRLKLRELSRTDPESTRIRRLERDLGNLAHLRQFALPMIETLAGWPSSATWGEWLARFETLAPQVLRRPARVLRVLAELRPMSAIGPVLLDEARDVLATRLLTLPAEPPRRRYGRVFVGAPQQARGRSFRVVFVPGLAERMFPRKLREDPMLLDDVRAQLNETSRTLVVQDDRTMQERLLLRLAVGAATERLYVSYPRLELTESRPRVPSFYLLDIMRAATGVVPSHDDLERAAAAASNATLDWPAPRDPARAIDDLEHDLAVLRPLLHAGDRSSARGQAHYILTLNDALRRAVVARWSRARQQWSPADGVVKVSDRTRPILDQHRLGARPYSVSALQRFAVCPYQFLLGAVHRLERREQPGPLQRMDPLMRGSFFHRVQADVLRALEADGLLPVTPDTHARALQVLDETIATVAAEYREDLVPAIDRVWRDEITALSTDLRIWLAKMVEETEWVPWRFELAFGLDPAGRDPRSVPDPVTIDDRFILRGSVDLVEQDRDGAALRVTDHKTGKDRSTPQLVIGGGAVLQPLVYSLAVQAVVGQPVKEGRLYYCTTVGGFHAHPIPLTEANRRAAIEALEVTDRALELGFLPAAPAPRACEWCDFRPICGPNEEQRVGRKAVEKLSDLQYLRRQP